MMLAGKNYTLFVYRSFTLILKKISIPLLLPPIDDLLRIPEMESACRSLEPSSSRLVEDVLLLDPRIADEGLCIFREPIILTTEFFVFFFQSINTIRRCG